MSGTISRFWSRRIVSASGLVGDPVDHRPVPIREDALDHDLEDVLLVLEVVVSGGRREASRRGRPPRSPGPWTC
jgi:hypothetical protein